MHRHFLVIHALRQVPAHQESPPSLGGEELAVLDSSRGAALSTNKRGFTRKLWWVMAAMTEFPLVGRLPFVPKEVPNKLPTGFEEFFPLEYASHAERCWHEG